MALSKERPNDALEEIGRWHWPLVFVDVGDVGDIGDWSVDALVRLEGDIGAAGVDDWWADDFLWTGCLTMREVQFDAESTI